MQRLLELFYARRNTRRLLAAGGREWGASHHVYFVILHGGWLLSTLLFSSGDIFNIYLFFLFVILQLARLWVIRTLGRHWTTRIIIVDGMSIIRHGPYRFMRHPNYAIVICEVAILPLVFGAWHVSLVFSLLNFILLWHRVRIEDAALDALSPKRNVYVVDSS